MFKMGKMMVAYELRGRKVEPILGTKEEKENQGKSKGRGSVVCS